MKKTNHFYRFCALALSCLLLISLLPVTQVLADGDGAIHIKSAEDLRSLAHSCTLDSWSRGKTVVLDNDIELTDDDELPIPTFGGTFNGNGHTISGLSITQSVSPAGLFGVLQKDAVIKNLNVEGTVTPSGDSENIGGIVGENHGTIESCTFNGSVSGKRSVGGIAGRNLATGIVRACEASGAIFGQSMTGGIVGENLGSIVSCRGRAYVNIESTDPSIDLSDLSLDFSLDLAKSVPTSTRSISPPTPAVSQAIPPARSRRAQTTPPSVISTSATILAAWSAAAADKCSRAAMKARSAGERTSAASPAKWSPMCARRSPPASSQQHPIADSRSSTRSRQQRPSTTPNTARAKFPTRLDLHLGLSGSRRHRAEQRPANDSIDHRRRPPTAPIPPTL